MKIKNPYNLTPIDPEFPWWMRPVEIVGQTLALIFFEPIVLLHKGTGWILEKVFNS